MTSEPNLNINSTSINLNNNLLSEANQISKYIVQNTNPSYANTVRKSTIFDKKSIENQFSISNNNNSNPKVTYSPYGNYSSNKLNNITQARYSTYSNYTPPSNYNRDYATYNNYSSNKTTYQIPDSEINTSINNTIPEKPTKESNINSNSNVNVTVNNSNSQNNYIPSSYYKLNETKNTQTPSYSSTYYTNFNNYSSNQNASNSNTYSVTQQKPIESKTYYISESQPQNIIYPYQNKIETSSNKINYQSSQLSSNPYKNQVITNTSYTQPKNVSSNQIPQTPIKQQPVTYNTYTKSAQNERYSTNPYNKNPYNKNKITENETLKPTHSKNPSENYLNELVGTINSVKENKKNFKKKENGENILNNAQICVSTYGDFFGKINNILSPIEGESQRNESLLKTITENDRK